MEKTKEKVRYRDLSKPMQIASIGGMFIFCYIVISMVLGIILGTLAVWT